MGKPKVMVAMSGGVDSSVAAALLKEEGFDVTGVTIKLWPKYIDPAEDGSGCCSLAAVEDARRVAQLLEIPYYVLNMQEEFQKNVIDKFSREYMLGRTPNPCIECNRSIKFGRLLEKAVQLGMDYIATGHYVRIVKEGNVYRLFRGRDAAKDQSYALYALTQDMLSRTLFPVGEYRKEEIRALARKFQLRIAAKPDSQEICFIPDNDYKGFLTKYAGVQNTPGNIVDLRGNVLGTHTGIFNYTIGQRKGLGLAVGEPLYVVDINPENNTVVVGRNADVFSREFTVTDFNWISGAPPAEEFDASVMIRYNAPTHPARIYVSRQGQVRIVFAQPQRAITPGQSAVIYDGDEVLGGGIILSRQLISDVKEPKK